MAADLSDGLQLKKKTKKKDSAQYPKNMYESSRNIKIVFDGNRNDCEEVFKYGPAETATGRRYSNMAQRFL